MPILLFSFDRPFQGQALPMPHTNLSQDANGIMMAQPAVAPDPGGNSLAPLKFTGDISAQRLEALNELNPASTRIRVLIVDDDELVRETFMAILTDEGYEVACADSATQALSLLSEQTFDVMLSDIYMPTQNGLELLDVSLVSYPDMPVILVTGYGNVAMARDALYRGASDFISKPCNPGELPIIVERNLTRQAVQRKNAQRHTLALQTSNETVLDALLTALNTRDTETEGHSERVTAYTIEMADLMQIPPAEMYHIERGALLHDIGKIGIPDRILLKPGKLTPDEWIEMRRHPIIGYEMCVRIDMLKIASRIVLHHHEAWDGSGYPHNLRHEEIPLGARIFAVADTLDAMTSDRPYRAAMPINEARDEICRFSAKQFDPEVVKVFLSIPDSRWQQVRQLASKASLH
jgi:putative nucleotidyltransferase with HDIG domain